MANKVIPLDNQMIRSLTRSQLQIYLCKYMRMSVRELAEAKKDPELPAMDHAIISVIVKAINEGDHNRLEFLFNRLYGRVPDKIEVTNLNSDYELAKSQYEQFRMALDANSRSIRQSIEARRDDTGPESQE